MPLSPPSSLESMHEDLLRLLLAVQRLPGKTGSYAEQVGKRLQNHMNREDEVALPLLGLVQEAAGGHIGQRAATRATSLYARMRRDYPRLSREQKELVRMSEQLKKFGLEEGHPTAIRFADSLEQHCLEDDELHFPTALLVGRIVSKPRTLPHARFRRN